jgi:diguanylate cyclase (GGDEF)-like protein
MQGSRRADLGPKMTPRRLVIGSSALVASVAAYFVTCLVLPPGSLGLTIVSDIGFLIVEAAALVLCVLAYLWNRARSDRWVWLGIAMWVAFNLFADATWAYYEVGRQVEVPSPGLTDVGYLASYIVGFATVVVAAWKACGRLRATEAMLDAAMLTAGVAGLGWRWLLGPLLQSTEYGGAYLINLAYVVGDLLIIMAFAMFFLASSGPGRRRPPIYLAAMCFGFLCQAVADSAYFVTVELGQEYGPGNWMDSVWLLAFAVAGVAALIAMHDARKAHTPSVTNTTTRKRAARPGGFEWSHLRIIIPYMALVVLVAVLFPRLYGSEWKLTLEERVLLYMGFGLVLVIVSRQYVILLQNRRLNIGLTRTSEELEERVGDLADLNQRLEALNEGAHRLNSLRTTAEIADAALELACSFELSPGGWISLSGAGGERSVAAVRGPVDQSLLDEPWSGSFDVALGLLRAEPLDIRDENLGTMFLLTPEGGARQPDLMPVIAAHVATAIDNAQKYEEVVHLAERDQLTGLFNYRGIHKRLAGESLRAQRSGSELSLIMIDLDDFKMLNDTYGHPVGDAVLRQVSEAIRAVLRHADLAGRVGGDELLIVLPNTGAGGAMLLGGRLIETLGDRPYVTPGGIAVPVGLSLGVATYPNDAQSLGQLIETADAHLYASKQRGGNTVTGSSAEEVAAKSDIDGVLGVAGRLLNVVGARDHYTRVHSEHVVLYALSLGQAIGLSEDSLSTLHVAAMLHDVGNIAVPAQFLRQPTALTAAEEDMVRRHVDMGASVIEDMPRLADVAAAVRAHHEHQDGSGYPAELSGDDIPILARVLAITDAYAAMTLDRPYRKPMTREQARAELEKAAGTQFDPELVRQFIQILDARDARAEAACAEVV